LRGFDATVWWGLVAPAKTPSVVVGRLSEEVNAALHDASVAKRLEDLGVVITPQTPEQFGRFIAAQTELWSRVVRTAGIRPD